MENLKKITVGILLILLLIFTACSNTKHKGDVHSVVSNIQVKNKIKDSEEKYSILAAYPDNQNVEKEVKIIIKDKNVWNLIDVNRKYTVHYASDNTEEYQLYTIEPLD